MRENIALALQARMGLRNFLRLAEQREIAEKLVAALGVKTASIETPIGLLSGGNQQKAIIARWLATHPRVLILDEPTRGIDIAAKQELMNEILAARATAAPRCCSSRPRSKKWCACRIASWCCAIAPRPASLPRGADEDAVYLDDRGQRVMKRLAQHALFWPATTLVLLLLVSAFSIRRSCPSPGAMVTCTAASSTS